MAQPEVHGPYARSLHEKMASYSERGRSVLVSGSTGVGKEALLRTYVGHPRWGYEGRIINCTALPSDLLESELFGHRKGAFAGASADRIGLVASAACLALDEIGDAAPAMQAKILRVVENGEYRRVGDDTVRNTSCVFVAATNKPEQLRDDLLWGFESRIRVPNLADRRTDLVHILFAISKRAGIVGFYEDCLAFLVGKYRWPGNARELRFVSQEAADRAAGNPVGLGDLPFLDYSATMEGVDDDPDTNPDSVWDLDATSLERAVARFGRTMEGFTDAELALAFDRLNYMALQNASDHRDSAKTVVTELSANSRDSHSDGPNKTQDPLRQTIESASNWKEAARIARREWFLHQVARGLSRTEIAAMLGVTPQALGQSLRRNGIT